MVHLYHQQCPIQTANHNKKLMIKISNEQALHQLWVYTLDLITVDATYKRVSGRKYRDIKKQNMSKRIRQYMLRREIVHCLTPLLTLATGGMEKLIQDSTTLWVHDLREDSTRCQPIRVFTSKTSTTNTHCYPAAS